MSLSARDNPSFIAIAIEAVKKIQQPLLLYGIVESVLLIVLLAFGKDVPHGLLPIVYALVVLILLIAIAHFALEFRQQCMGRREEQPCAEISASGAKTFACSDSAEFVSCVEALVRRCRRFVLIGTGLNILHRDPFMKEVLNRAAKGDCHLEIYLADPQSPDIETRLIEEELGEIKPPVGQRGLIQRLDTLLQLWKDLRYPETIRIHIFTHYPTFALLIIDQDYFFYPYGYATLGNFSPVMRFSRDNPEDRKVIEFFDNQYRYTKAHAPDAREVLAVRRFHSANISGLYPLAVYIIPPKGSPLYEFGTQILGYDVRGSKMIHSPWQEQVGNARDFGFHLTVCDALYFWNEATAKMAKSAVEFLARAFKPFEITNLCLKPQCPDPTSLAIVGDEHSGTLEALHCELVYHVYRRAAASNYSLGLADLKRDQDIERARLMISRYKAPYIFQRYRPHFTLLTNVSPETLPEVYEALNTHFNDRVQERTLRVEKLALMTRPTPDSPWVIEKEIELGETG